MGTGRRTAEAVESTDAEESSSTVARDGFALSALPFRFLLDASSLLAVTGTLDCEADLQRDPATAVSR